MELISVDINSTKDSDFSIEKMASYLDIEINDIDEEFGVICIDPEKRRYALMVNSDVVKTIKNKRRCQISGPFSNPKIEVFNTSKNK